MQDILATHNLGSDNSDEHNRFVRFTAEGRAVSCHYTGIFLTTRRGCVNLWFSCMAAHAFQNSLSR